MVNVSFFLYVKNTGEVIYISENVPENDFENDNKVPISYGISLAGINWTNVDWEVIKSVKLDNNYNYKFENNELIKMELKNED